MIKLSQKRFPYKFLSGLGLPDLRLSKLGLASLIGLSLFLTMPNVSQAKMRPIFKAYLGAAEHTVAPMNAIVQSHLKFLDYYQGKIDNDFGRGSRRALKNFQKSQGLYPGAVINRSSVRALEKAVARKIKKRFGRTLDGRWAKLGKCKRKSVEVKGNVVIKRHLGRLAVPRLDFLMFDEEDSLTFLMADKKADFRLSAEGYLDTPPLTNWLLSDIQEKLTFKKLPRPKPEALELQARGLEQCGF